MEGFLGCNSLASAKGRAELARGQALTREQSSRLGWGAQRWQLSSLRFWVLHPAPAHLFCISHRSQRQEGWGARWGGTAPFPAAPKGFSRLVKGSKHFVPGRRGACARMRMGLCWGVQPSPVTSLLA